MFELWFRNDGPVNPPALICKPSDNEGRSNFFPEVVIDQETVVFGGHFSRVELAVEAVRETLKPGYEQEIVFGTGVSEVKP